MKRPTGQKLKIAIVRQKTAVLLSVAVLVLSAVLTAGCGFGSEPALRDPSMKATPAQSESQKVGIDELLCQEEVVEQEISRGKVAWVKGAYRPGHEHFFCELLLTDLETRMTSRLASFDEGVEAYSLQWSPDGEALGFLCDGPLPGSGDDDGDTRVWVARPATGQVLPLTDAPDDIFSFAWCGPGSVVYAAGDSEGQNPETDGDDTVHVSEYANTPVRLFRLDIEGHEVQRLTDNDDRITSLHVSPDGSRAFVTRTRSIHDDIQGQYYQDIPIKSYMIDLGSGGAEPVFKDVRQVESAAWSPDSRTLYVVEDYTTGRYMNSYVARVRALDLDSGEESLVDLDWPRGVEPGSDLCPTTDGFVALLSDGCNPRLAWYSNSASGWERRILKGTHQGNIFGYDVTPDGMFISYDHSSQSTPPQCFVASLDGDRITGEWKYTALNPGLEGKVLAHSETITWRGALGDDIEGMLFYPAGYEPGGKYPLVLVLHGGPFGVTHDMWAGSYRRWAYPYQLLTQKGALVLDPNYHGSSCYGLEFAMSIEDGKYYEYPLEDIRSGVARLVELGLADEGGLGTMGWSNGSILSNALIASDDRFKAASCGAGGAEWVSLWGPCPFGDGTLSNYLGADPVEDPDLYKNAAMAPFYNAGKVKTPVIMFMSGADEEVPPSQTWVTYRGIQKHGSAPVELYMFPGESHVLKKLSHQRRKMVEEQKWFDEYLFSPEGE